MKRCTCLLLGTLLIASPLRAQQQQNRWEIEFAPYIWMADNTGEQTVRGIRAPVDLDFFDDILEHLDQAFLFHLEANKGRWSLILDPVLLALETSESGPLGTVDTRADTSIVDLKVGYRLGRGALQLIGGLRYYDSGLDIAATTGVSGISISQDENWWDLVAGARYRWNAAQRWTVVLEGDVGGFDFSNSSDLSWNASLVATYTFKPRFDLAFGYRILDVDYDAGAGAQRFLYDIQTSGPLVGVNFSF